MNETETQQRLSELAAELADCITLWADGNTNRVVAIDTDTMEVGSESANLIIVDREGYLAFLGNFDFEDILRDSSAQAEATRYMSLFGREIIEKIEEKIEENQF